MVSHTHSHNYILKYVELVLHCVNIAVTLSLYREKNHVLFVGEFRLS